jgi:hypothetical protein
VKGNSNAIAIDGEIPGSAPPRIPQATPAIATKTSGVPVSNLAISRTVSKVVGYPFHGAGISMPSTRSKSTKSVAAPAHATKHKRSVARSP